VPLLTALCATAMLMALGLALALLGASETTLAARDRDARAAEYAARAAIALGATELRLLPSWSAVLRSGTQPELAAAPARVIDSTLTPTVPWGGTLDLRALTRQLQAETDSAGTVGDPLAWRLFAYTPLSRVAPVAAASSRLYLAVWVSDDPADGDHDASADTNGSIVIHAEALGAEGLRAAIEATIQRLSPPGGGPDLIRLLSVRPRP
jgi:hypothetical protein